MKEIFLWQNSPTFLVKFLPIRYLVFLLVFVYKALVDELKMITTQVGTHNRSEIAVHGTFCTIPLLNSNY
jgi:hypothetical protein